MEKVFTCKGCGHELSEDFSLRTQGWCYLCDPNITLGECLSDEPIQAEQALKPKEDEHRK